jgi:uncharacterized protein (UPF0335 family)
MTAQFATVTEALSEPETSAATLKRHVEAIRKLKDQIKQINDALAFRYMAVKNDGFDKDLVRLLVKRLDSDPKELAEEEDMLHLYESWYRGEEPDENEMAAAAAIKDRKRQHLDA